MTSDVAKLPGMNPTDRRVAAAHSTSTARPRLAFVAAGLLIAFAAEVSYATVVQPIYEYTGMKYEPEIRAQMLPWVIATVIVCLGLFSTTLKPGHMFALVVFVFVHLGALTVAPHFLGYETFAPIARTLMISMAMIAIAANLSLPVTPRGHPTTFRLLLWGLLALCALPIATAAVTNGVRLPGFANIYELREDLVLGGPAGYAIHAYTFAIGPLAMAWALTRRNAVLLLTGIGLYVLCYAISFQKTLIIAPLLIVAVWWLLGWVRVARPLPMLILYASPFLLALTMAKLSAEWEPYAAGYVLHRMYTLPGQVFAHYVDFFSNNPYTWFSHITGVNWFITYPYDEVPALVIKEFYPGGNQNASFWTQDAVAGAGVAAIPYVSLVFCVVLVLVNTSARGLDLRFAATAFSMSAQRFSDGSLPTALLSGGLALLILMIWIAPRAGRTDGRPIAREPSRCDS